MQPQNPNTYNLSNLFADFTAFLRADNRLSTVSKRNYLSDVKQFINWLQARNSNNTLNKCRCIISEDNLTSYFEYLVSENRPARSINRKLSSLRHLLGYCLSNGLITDNYAKSIPNINQMPSLVETFSLENELSERERNDIEDFLVFLNQ